MCHYLLRLGVDSDEVDPKAAAKHLAGDGGVQVLAKSARSWRPYQRGRPPLFTPVLSDLGDEPAEWPRWFTGWSCQA